MYLTNRQDFLACLDRYPEQNELTVFTHSRSFLLAAVDRVGFNDFRGHDYEVIGRLAEVLHRHDSDEALWGRVHIDLWYCSNFGGPHWRELVSRDPTNVRFAIQAAHSVYMDSGSDGGPDLASIIDSCRCWDIAETYVSQQSKDWSQAWWQRRVLPHKTNG